MGIVNNMTGQAQSQKIKTGVNTFPKKYVNINAVGKTINGKAGSYSIKMIKINGKLQDYHKNLFLLSLHMFIIRLVRILYGDLRLNIKL